MVQCLRNFQGAMVVRQYLHDMSDRLLTLLFIDALGRRNRKNDLATNLLR